MSRTAREPRYDRIRDSIFIVKETHGIPFKIVSLIIALIFFVTGLRGILSPEFALSGTEYEKERLKAMFEDYGNGTRDLWIFYAGLAGLLALTNAALRLLMATTTHVAELYNTMQFIVLMDAG